MHVKTKKLTVSAMLLALSVLLIYMGNIIESSTLFFLAMASFCVGVVQREYGITNGWIFLLANILLGLTMVPQKLYMLTFGAFSVYILLTEQLWNCIAKRVNKEKMSRVFLFGRLAVFNLLYVPLALAMPKMLLGEAMLTKFGQYALLFLLLGGQIFLFLFDRAYVYFQGVVWERIRRAVRL